MTRVGFAVGTGRCGTKFLADVFAHDKQIASSHERHAVSDTFHRYCQWYGISVDEAGFVATKRRAIEADLQRRSYSFEASAFLSLSMGALRRAFDARIVMMIRRPDRVVASYINKGWYASEPHLDNPDLPPTMQDVALPHHFLGRTMPRGEEFIRWRALTRVGKIAWFWNTLNRTLVQQAGALDGTARFQKLESLNYAAFEDLCAFLGVPNGVRESAFAAVRSRKPNASFGAQSVGDWSLRERVEFETEVREMAEHFGYEWRTAQLAKERPLPWRRSIADRMYALSGLRRA